MKYSITLLETCIVYLCVAVSTFAQNTQDLLSNSSQNSSQNLVAQNVVTPYTPQGQTTSQVQNRDPAVHLPEAISDINVAHNVNPEPGNKWEWEFNIQSGFWANQWGATGGIQEYGVDGGWGYFGEGGNSSYGLNVDNTGFQLYQMWAGVGRQFELNSDWHFDVHADFMYGTNAQFFQSINRFDYMALSKGQYGFALPQLYAGLGTEKFHVKVGKFLTPFGNDHDGFFFSDSYSTLPDTHMGVMANWEPCDGLELLCGWTQGWNEAFDCDSDSSLVWFGIGKKLSEKVEIGYTMSAGRMDAFESAYAHSLLLEMFLTKKFTYALEYQLVSLHNGEYLNWLSWGLINCFIYEMSDSLSAGLRVEYQELSLDDAVTGMFEITLGYTWKPFSKDKERHQRCCLSTKRLFDGELLIRPEIRYDSWSGANSCGFCNCTQNHQFSGGISLDYSF